MSVCVTYEKAGQAEGFDKVVLLSGSPRRRELLAFLNPTIQIPSIDERAVQEQSMARYAKDDFVTRVAKTCCDISIAKSEIPLVDGTLYIAADTMVICDDKVYNKPLDRVDARRMLMSYFGKTHHVVTSVCLRTTTYIEVFYSVASITFVPYYDEMSELVDDYIASDSPMDKAGAYGIQDLDPRFVASITGDVHTIIGLPVSVTAQKIYHIKNS